MKRFTALLHEVGLALGAVALLLESAFALKLVLSRPAPASLDLSWLATPAGQVSAAGAGLVTFGLGLYFLIRLWALLGRRRRFSRDGLQGPIEVSTEAIEGFIHSLLEAEPALERGRVRLHHSAGGGLEVALSVSLRVGASFVELAERLQQRLKGEVEGRLGIEVHRVRVYAGRIGLSPVAAPQHTSEGEDDNEH